jgi:hypothetical protein
MEKDEEDGDEDDGGRTTLNGQHFNIYDLPGITQMAFFRYKSVSNLLLWEMKTSLNYPTWSL